MKNMWISTAVMTLVRATNTDIKQWTLLTPAFLASPISGLFLVANSTCRSVGVQCAMSQDIIVPFNSTFILRDFLRKRCQKKGKKLTSVSFMYVCVARNGEMLVFFLLFVPTIV